MLALRIDEFFSPFPARVISHATALFVSVGVLVGCSTTPQEGNSTSGTSPITSGDPAPLTEFSKELVQNSPYNGGWQTPDGSDGGTFDLVFKERDDRVYATIQDGTGVPYDYSGPVQNLTINPDAQRVSFLTTSGAEYRLELTQDNLLTGVAAGTGGAQLTVRPTDAE